MILSALAYSIRVQKVVLKFDSVCCREIDRGVVKIALMVYSFVQNCMQLSVCTFWISEFLSLKSGWINFVSFWRPCLLGFDVVTGELGYDNRQHRILTASLARNLRLTAIFQFLRHFIDPRQINHFFKSVGPPTNCIFLDLLHYLKFAHRFFKHQDFEFHRN